MSEPLADRRVRANGVEFACLERGAGPLVLCLHGFPDTPMTFAAQVPALVDAGFRVVAPYLRGYPPTSQPADGDFDPLRLGEDVVALVRALGEEQACVFGHDWGAVSGYVAANLAPDRVRRLATAAVPPLRTLRPSLAQVRRSWYMAFFQVPLVAERVVRARGFAFVERLWRTWSPSWRFTADDLGPIERVLADPAGLAAALGYYRAAFRPRSLDARHRRAGFGRIRVPGLVFAGVEDGCMGVETFAGAERAFDAPCEVVRVAGAGHFLHRERPDLVNERLVRFFSAAR